MNIDTTLFQYKFKYIDNDTFSLQINLLKNILTIFENIQFNNFSFLSSICLISLDSKYKLLIENNKVILSDINNLSNNIQLNLEIIKHEYANFKRILRMKQEIYNL